MDDSEEFKHKIEARYTLEELMAGTGLSGSWIRKVLDDKGIVASGKRGRSKVYDGFAADELLKSKPRPKNPKKSETSETPQASKTSQEYEELISQMGKEIKTLQSQMLKIARKLKDHIASHNPEMS